MRIQGIKQPSNSNSNNHPIHLPNIHRYWRMYYFKRKNKERDLACCNNWLDRHMVSCTTRIERRNNIQILNNCKVESYEDLGSCVVLKTSQAEFKTRKLFIATNAFAGRLNIAQVKPARNQVLITKPIKDLKLTGTYHLDEGYTYFRTIDNRILLGGGRNLNLTGEQTDSFGTTSQIQQYLEGVLKGTILPGISLEIEHRWSGILGVGDQKHPVLKSLSDNVFCGVRLGGMGIAIGSQVGKKLADLSRH